MHLPKAFRQMCLRLTDPLTEQGIRTAYVNCAKGEAKHVLVPLDPAERFWGDLEKQGNSVGAYMCGDRACPLCTLRDKKDAGVGARLHASLTPET
ncbi:hypothetical protein [Streptomyces sp. NPDC087538]|uniref:hypothetical protein n=1 Tax=Streptomyces sp. NPDC087538 TaxID=3365797 RepID=UPI0038203AE2